MKIEVIGNLIKKSAIEVFASGFKKRTIVVEARVGSFITEYPFELHKDDVELVAGLKKDALIKVRGFVQVNKGPEGSSYAGKRFVSLKATGVEVVGGYAPAWNTPAPAPVAAPKPAAVEVASDEGEDLPF